jgi:thiol-disulfide isomerase/thioredoxin
MKKFTTLLIGCCLSIFAFATEGVNFVKNLTWSQILAKAAREKKMIFFDAYTTWCGPCKYLEQNVYTDADVAAYFNANYINVKFDMEEGEGVKLAEQFDITSYPTLIFFGPNGKPVHKVIGAMDANDFLQLGKDAKDPSKQYYTLKNKISTKQGSTADFLLWTEMANDLEDTNRGATAASWLSAQKDILGTAELARAALLYTDVTESQLVYLYTQKNKIQELLGWDQMKTEHALYRKLFNMAMTAYEKDNSPQNFLALIRKFDAARTGVAWVELKMIDALTMKDSEEAMKLLSNGLTAKDRIYLDDLCFLFLDYSTRFNKADIETLVDALNKYSFTSSDKGKECWLYLTNVICYAKLENAAKSRENAELAMGYAELPESYRLVLKESYGL